MARQPWDDVLDRIRVNKSPENVYPFRPTSADLDAAEEALGCRLPASYRAFAERCGLDGELIGWIQLYALVAEDRDQECVLAATRYWRDDFAASGVAENVSILGDAYAGRLIVFGRDDTGYPYAFHSGEVTDAQLAEYKVYELDPVGDGTVYRADTFAGFLDYADRRGQQLAITGHLSPADASSAIEYTPWRRQRVPFSGQDVRAWLAASSGAARNLALAIRDEARPDLFPILADALEDAGCTSQHVLRACRDGNPQADGDWVLAVLLGERTDS